MQNCRAPRRTAHIFLQTPPKVRPVMEYVTVRHGGEGAAQDILGYANENGCDIICMGANVDRLRKKESYLRHHT